MPKSATKSPPRAVPVVEPEVASHAPTSRISLVNPRNNERHKIVAPLIGKPHSAYYLFNESEESYAQLTRHILETLQAQESSSRNGAVPALASEADHDAGRALGSALAKLSIEVLILDDADLLKEDPTEWINGLLSSLSDGTRVVIAARTLNASYWNPLIASGAVSVLGDTLGKQVLDGTPGQLEVYALGTGAVWYEGRPVVHWDGPLTRRLFYFLLDRGPVSRLAIFEAFWPNLPIREATNVFHVTKRKMNETIGCDATDYQDRHYAVSERVRLFYDVAVFESALREAEAGQGDESNAPWQRAVQLYRHPFLFEETTAWIVERRNILRDGYAQSLIGLARNYQKHGEGQLALLHYLRAIREAPTREDLFLQVMKLYVDQNNKAAALTQYERLRHNLTTLLGINPAKEIAQLATKLSR